MKYAKKIVAAIAVSTAFAAPAFAGTIGMADLSITGLGVYAANGVQLTNGITITSETRTGTATAQFNGVDASGAGNDTVKLTNLKGPIPLPAQVDVKYRCGGPDCGAATLAGYYGTVENNTSTHIGAPVGNFALGDMLLGGSALSAGGASGLTRADSSVTGPNNSATANATIANSVTATASFTAGATVLAQFKLSYNAFLATIVNPAAGVSGGALATISYVLTLIDEANPLVTLLTFNPAEINKGKTANDAAGSFVYQQSGNVASSFVQLIGGHKYQLAINQTSNSLAEEIRDVPEPGSMFLVALGLFGLGVASRRRSK